MSLPPITQPLTSVEAWARAIDARPLPVLASTAWAVDEMRQNEDAIDAHLLTQAVALDPLMTLKLLRHVAVVRQGRGTTDAETVTEALVMLGITPFFRAFEASPPTVDAILGADSEALAGFHAVLKRAQRASRFALGFAIHLQDPDAAVIHEAALLHDFAEMLLWVHAPVLAGKIANQQLLDPTLRSNQAQAAVLNIELQLLQQALMRQWRLPALLVQLDDDRSAQLRQVRTVNLAIRLARHSAQSWHNPAVPDDLDDLSKLLSLSAAHTLTLCHDIDS
jgi:HD-like signal output (HDOD) protein